MISRRRPEAIEAAKNADVVVAVVGITSELEGEEMQVHEEGFMGGDRTSIDLPKPEEELLQALGATGKPLVVVLTNGSALAVNWANEHANAILDAFYPGEEGGTAVAQTLSGRNNPAGRLPVTFYTDVSQLPPFEDYSMKGRTYRYFQGTPLYPFGYGLSYTKFTYSDLMVPPNPVDPGSLVSAEVTVTNSGKKAGDEVAQLYLSFPDVAGAPLRALRGFQRVHLEPGASQKVRFELQQRDLSMVTDAGRADHRRGKLLSVGRRWPAAYNRTGADKELPGEREDRPAGITTEAKQRALPVDGSALLFVNSVGSLLRAICDDFSHLQVNGIRPAEADHIFLIACADLHIRIS